MNLPEPGDVMHGKYRVLRMLGEGGMGCVFAATHLHLDEAVAIKILRPESIARAESVARFVREARTTMKLKSEHIVRVFDVDMMNGAIPFIVMEMLEGRDLASMSAEGAVEIVDAVRWMLQACEGIAEAHALGIVHRDLKPANLFLTTAGCVKVLDFGVSKVSSRIAVGTVTEPESEPKLAISMNGGSLRAVSLDRNLTQTNALLGSPQYMAPEQLRSAREADTRTDVWALGAILYELLTARPPFSASDSSELAERIRTFAPKRARDLRPSIPAGLDAIVLRCLRKDSAERFADVAELAEALASFGGKEGNESARRTRRTLHGVESPKRRAWMGGFALAFVACALAIGWAVLPRSALAPSPAPAIASVPAPTNTQTAENVVSLSPPAIASTVPPIVTTTVRHATQSRASASAVPCERPKLDPTHAFDDPE